MGIYFMGYFMGYGLWVLFYGFTRKNKKQPARSPLPQYLGAFAHACLAKGADWVDWQRSDIFRIKHVLIEAK